MLSRICRKQNTIERTWLIHCSLLLTDYAMYPMEKMLKTAALGMIRLLRILYIFNMFLLL